VSWILPTATARYVVDLAAEDAGPVLQDWTDGEIRTWAPSDQHSFDTPPDRLPSELSALGTRQVRGADLVVDHGGALVGARLVWPAGGVDFTEDGPRTRLTAHGHDTTGDLELMLEIEASREHDVVSKRVSLFNSGSRATPGGAHSGRPGSCRSVRGRWWTSWAVTGEGEFTAIPDRPAGG
jgi:alpha-galactosidase